MDKGGGGGNPKKPSPYPEKGQTGIGFFWFFLGFFGFIWGFLGFFWDFQESYSSNHKVMTGIFSVFWDFLGFLGNSTKLNLIPKNPKKIPVPTGRSSDWHWVFLKFLGKL